MNIQSVSDNERLVVSPGRAWHMLGIGNTHGYQLLATGELDSYLDGRRRLITVASIKRYVERKIASASAASTCTPRLRTRAAETGVAR